MRINNKELSKEKIIGLVNDIKKKKEFRAVEDSFVLSIVKKFLEQNKKILRELSERADFERFKKSEGYKKIIKYARTILRKTVGVYSTKLHKQNQELLRGLSNVLRREKLDSEDSLRIHQQILSTHRSTKERLGIYSKLYSKIFEKTGIPESILDLGCGLNPVSYPWMELEDISYYAVDVNENDLEIIKRYFEIAGIKGSVRKRNLQKIVGKNILEEFPKVDVCFLFKVLESLELGKGHKISEEIIRKVKAEWIVVSFATKTLSGKRMRVVKRVWFERMLKRLGFVFSKFQEESELFYVFRKR